MSKSSRPRYTYPAVNEGDALKEFQCVSFFIPLGWWNRGALAGAFFHMGYPFMWPDTPYGLEVAEAWREAYYLSKEAGLDMQTVTNVYNEIIVNSGGGGGCCELPDGQTVPSIPITIGPTDSLDPVEPDNTDQFVESVEAPLPPAQYVDAYPSWQEFNEQKCLAANFYAEKAYRSIDTLKNLMEATLGETLQALIGAFVLAVSDGPLPAGDALFISILIVPPVINWIRDSGTDRSETIDWVTSLDQCEMTQIIYDATSNKNLGEAFGDYLIQQLNTTNISPLGKTWMTAYINFQFRNSFANFVYGNLDKFIPADYVAVCDCEVAPVVEGHWPSPWTFPVDLQGWTTEPDSTANAQWYDYGPTGDVHSPPGAMVIVSTDPLTSDNFKVSLTIPASVDVVMISSSGIELWLRSGNVFPSKAPVLSVITTFRDGTVHQSGGVNVPPGTDSRIVLLGRQENQLFGKIIDKITLNVQTEANWGITGASVRFDDISLGD